MSTRSFLPASPGRIQNTNRDVTYSRKSRFYSAPPEKSVYTDPDQTVEFVERTDCDSLAIAIGTSHGAYKFAGEAKLDFARLEKIGSLLPDYPLVLHGASSVIPEFVDMANAYGGHIAGAKGVPEDLLRKAATLAVCKINIDTDIRLAVTASREIGRASCRERV